MRPAFAGSAAVLRRPAPAGDAGLIGRDGELAAFRAALAGNPCARPVHYLHGPAGIGKTALLRGYAAAARAAGRPVIELDAAALPAPAGFGRAAVLLIDGFEPGRNPESWLWQRFLPALPVGVVVAVAGRNAPDPGWTLDPGWDGLAEITALGDLDARDAAAVLGRHGAPAHTHRTLLALAGGNPGALALAAGLARRGEMLTGGGDPRPGAVRLLDRRLLDDVPGARHRAALEVCAYARVTTEELLRAVLGADAPALFDWLRARPYVRSGPAGLTPHRAVRAVVAAGLRLRDPDGFAALHHRMRGPLVERVRAASGATLARAVGDLLYLYRADPLMDGLGDRPDTAGIEEIRYTPRYRADVLRLVRAAEGEEPSAAAARWLDRRPEAFLVQRDVRTGQIAGFFGWLRLDAADGESGDPVASPVWQHADRTGSHQPGGHLTLAWFGAAGSREPVAGDHRGGRLRPPAPAALSLWRTLGEIIQAGGQTSSYVRGPGAGLLQELGAAVTGGSLVVLDRRARSVPAWLCDRSDTLLGGGSPADLAPPRHEHALSRPDFGTAVRDALRRLHGRRPLDDSPLQRSRLIREHGGELGDVLRTAVDGLREERQGEKWHRALTVTYFKGVPTQSAAAQRLGLPFGTYRRHLTTGIEALTDDLWRREIE